MKQIPIDDDESVKDYCLSSGTDFVDQLDYFSNLLLVDISVLIG